MTLPLYRLINEGKHAVNVISHWQILHTQLRVCMCLIVCIRVSHTVLEYSSERK